ncbi:MAG: patatin-like phospholipase family protein [Thermoflexales bacterium]
MRTFVLSGGGNRGPLEVGALRALLERGIQPEMIVGSSAGALNGAMLASNPTLEMTHQMRQLWIRAGERRLISASPGC